MHRLASCSLLAVRAIRGRPARRNTMPAEAQEAAAAIGAPATATGGEGDDTGLPADTTTATTAATTATTTTTPSSLPTQWPPAGPVTAEQAKAALEHYHRTSTTIFSSNPTQGPTFKKVWMSTAKPRTPILPFKKLEDLAGREDVRFVRTLDSTPVYLPQDIIPVYDVVHMLLTQYAGEQTVVDNTCGHVGMWACCRVYLFQFLIHVFLCSEDVVVLEQDDGDRRYADYVVLATSKSNRHIYSVVSSVRAEVSTVNDINSIAVNMSVGVCVYLQCRCLHSTHTHTHIHARTHTHTVYTHAHMQYIY